MTKYTKESCIEAIQRFYEIEGRVPLVKDFKNNKQYPSYNTVIKYIGTWNEAIEAAGFTTRNKWDKENIIEAIQYFYNLNNKVPQYEDFKNNTKYPSNSTVQRYFGTWNEAIEAAGLTKHKWDKENIIEAIQYFYKINSKIPGTRDFIGTIYYPSSSTVTKYFGTWNKAIEAAGLTKHKWDKENIIEAIQCFYKINSKIPRYEDFANNKQYPSYNTVIRHFGTWNIAIEAAGFTTRNKQKLEELLKL